MSASSKKKLRKEQKVAAATEKQKAAKKEATKLKIYTATFWIALVLCVCLVAGLALKAPITTLCKKVTTAVVIGDHKLSNVDLSYFYIDSINEYCNQYSQYLSYFLDTSKPLDQQQYSEGKTWADAFLDMAIDSAKNTYALYDAAIAAGHKLSDDEQKSVNELYDSMEPTAKNNGYKSVNAYLKAFYGNGANEKSYCEYYEVTVMASSYYTKYVSDLKDSYDEPILREYEKDKEYEYSSFSYLSHYLSVDSFKMGGTKGSDGKVTYSDEEIKAAEKAVEEAAKELAVEGNNTKAKLDAAIEVLEKKLNEQKAEANKTDDKKEENKTEDKKEDDKSEDKKEDDKKEENKKEETVKYSTATENKDVLYSSVNSVMQEWLRSKDRKAGDITFLKNTTKTTDKDGKEVETLKGYYVIVYQETNDNTYKLPNIRHILISFKGGTPDKNGKVTYSAAEKEAARKEAYAILDKWHAEYGVNTSDLKAGEDAFAALAEKHSTDPGSNTNGGLYEEIYPGQMVTAFNDWCFDKERKAGDTGVVATEYGYHVMYYSGGSDLTYRNYLVTSAKLQDDVTKWQENLNNSITVDRKNTKFIEGGLVLNSGK
jgi:hypothetical protein